MLQLIGVACVHALHAEHVGIPHAWPSVFATVHGCVSVVIVIAHAPLMHVGVVTVRVCMPPLVLQPLAMHADHAPIVTPPQDMPVVVRVHACDSGLVAVVHAPAWQLDVVTVRVCMADSAQVLA